MPLTSPWEFENPSCASIGVELFYRNEFNDDGTLSNTSVIELNQVKEVCRSCPCLDECAEWGISKERWGIWGGLTPKERERIRRRRRRSGHMSRGSTLLP